MQNILERGLYLVRYCTISIVHKITGDSRNENQKTVDDEMLI
jgi:hypothetical protein